MNTEETIKKLIEKYETEIEDLTPIMGRTENREFSQYLKGKIENNTKFLTDLKQLQETLK